MTSVGVGLMESDDDQVKDNIGAIMIAAGVTIISLELVNIRIIDSNIYHAVIYNCLYGIRFKSMSDTLTVTFILAFIQR